MRYIVVALLAALGTGAALVYDIARPHVHPIKVADQRKMAERQSQLLAARALTVAPPAIARPTGLFGTADVVDGDTLIIGGVTADLWTIDAPELEQYCERGSTRWPCGQDSRRLLQSLVKGRRVACRPEGPPEPDGRFVGLCFVRDTPCGQDNACESDLTSLNLAMVEHGAAMDIEGQYMDAQADAREQKIGIWRGRLEPP
ncbi:thermonuclease family protein [Sphingomonas sp.]|uniref:thermonuclease family protein n=1 Tax=Sphingomonas sp. TaxID=28214 RepID=UPI003D6C7EE8